MEPIINFDSVVYAEDILELIANNVFDMNGSPVRITPGQLKVISSVFPSRADKEFGA